MTQATQSSAESANLMQQTERKPTTARETNNPVYLSTAAVVFGIAGMLIIALAFLFDLWAAINIFIARYAHLHVDKFLVGVVIAGITSFFYLLYRNSELQQRFSQQESLLEKTQGQQEQLSGLIQKQEIVHSELIARQELSNKLVKLTRSTTHMTSLNVALQNILQSALEVTGAELGSLFLLDASQRVLDSFISRRQIDPVQTRKLTGQVMRDGLAGWVVKHSEAVLLHDAEQDDRWIQIAGSTYVAGSVMGVPITIDNMVVGVLTLIHGEKYHFGDDDLELMESAASQMALTLQNAQIFEEQRRTVERQIALYEILRVISHQLESSGVTRRIVDTAARLTGWSTVAILTPNQHKTSLHVQAVAGTIWPQQPYSIPLDSEHAAALAYLQNKTETKSNIRSLSDHAPLHPDIQCETFVPLSRGGDPTGLLVFGDVSPYSFEQDEVVLATAIGEAASLALDNTQLFETVSVQRSRLEALIGATRDGIIFVHQKTQVILVINQPAIDLLLIEGTPLDWEGQNVHRLREAVKQIDVVAAESFEREIYRLQTNNEVVTDDEFDVKSSSVSASYLPVMNEEASIGRLFVLRDVTEAKLVEQMRRDITHTMVHDLRNPLHMIGSGLSLLNTILNENFSLAESEKQLLHITSANADKMLRLVNSILDISRLERGRLPLEQEALDLEKLIANTVTLLEPMAQEKSIQVKSEIGSGTKYAWADSNLIGRILQNLIDNALKFTPAGGCVSIKSYLNADKKIRVDVIDTGTGIPNHLIDRVFEKFARGDQQEKGSGIGLAFCRMAIEAHGEEIWVDQTSPDGTTFSFTLPIISETGTAD